MKHALVVGGTGMMGGVSCWLVEQGRTVSVVARRPDVLPCTVNPIALDYRQSDALRREIENAISEHGKIDLVACWIHNSAPDAPDLVAEVLNRQTVPVRYVHLLGSASAEPTTWQDGNVTTFSQHENITYQRVVLGFVVENKGSRWLTNREIRDGVIGAILLGNDVMIVGQIRPWNKRP